jgi:hypothetical protein
MLEQDAAGHHGNQTVAGCVRSQVMRQCDGVDRMTDLAGESFP